MYTNLFKLIQQMDQWQVLEELSKTKATISKAYTMVKLLTERCKAMVDS